MVVSVLPEAFFPPGSAAKISWCHLLVRQKSDSENPMQSMSAVACWLGASMCFAFAYFYLFCILFTFIREEEGITTIRLVFLVN